MCREWAGVWQESEDSGRYVMYIYMYLYMLGYKLYCSGKVHAHCITV